jgi:hypothetical protein
VVEVAVQAGAVPVAAPTGQSHFYLIRGRGALASESQWLDLINLINLRGPTGLDESCQIRPLAGLAPAEVDFWEFWLLPICNPRAQCEFVLLDAR